jgi:hypothetical protein
VPDTVEGAMKKAGDLLSALFDEKLLKKAQGYSDLFSSWTRVTEGCGIPVAAAHSRITELERTILLVEADHPGWVQILQTKQTQLLNMVQRRFPTLEIRGISFRLSRDPASFTPSPAARKTEPADPETAPQAASPVEPETEPYSEGEPDGNPLDRIEDKEFLATLKRLKQGLKKRPPR